MESKGRLVDASKDFFSGKWKLTFEVESLPNVDNLSGRDLRVSAVQWREKRSLNANSYFHMLCGKIADALGSSLTETKNHLMSEWGELDIDEDGKARTVIIRDDIPWESIEWLHLKPTPRTKTLDDGRLYRVYLVIKPSHLYDSKSMSRLISGAVEGAKELGIETLTENELRRMNALWKTNTGNQ